MLRNVTKSIIDSRINEESVKSRKINWLKELAVVTSPTSYLQSLDKDESISFVASLQKVKEHLTHELQWINAQATQKTTQLQGIEAILTEAVVLGLIAESLPSTPVSNIHHPVASVADASELSYANGSFSLAESIDSTDLESAPATESVDLVSDRVAVNNAKPKATTQSSTSRKSVSSKSKSTSSGKRPLSKAGQAGKSPDLKHFVKPEFQEQSFTDAVAQILEAAKKPIGLSDVIAKLYVDLSNQDYQRAKISLTNVLSTGKNKGKWKSMGRGMYASNAVGS
jgi:hypothetical protein